MATLFSLLFSFRLFCESLLLKCKNTVVRVSSPIKMITLLLLITPLLSCGIVLNEESAHAVMKKIYAARKKGNFSQEFSYYARKDFSIVPFGDVTSTMRNIIGGAGRFKSAKHLNTKVSRRNQLGKGLVKYMVLTYHSSYEHIKLEESYYFLGESEIPKMVYMTLQYP